MNEQLKQDIALLKTMLEWFTLRHKGSFTYSRDSAGRIGFEVEVHKYD